MGAYSKVTKVNEARLRAHLSTPRGGLYQSNTGHGLNEQMHNEFSHDRNMEIHAQHHTVDQFGSLGVIHSHDAIQIKSFNQMGSGIQKHMADQHGAGFLPNYNAAVAHHAAIHAGTASRGIRNDYKGALTPSKITTNQNRVLYRVKKYSRGR
jgi:hypothetical protein